METMIKSIKILHLLSFVSLMLAISLLPILLNAEILTSLLYLPLAYLTLAIISFNIENNKTMALVGESGSGKSVTAMSILQLLPRPQASYSQASSIKFKGDEIIDAPNNKLLNIRGNIVSMVFQEPILRN